jgi:hypothetical protein
MNFITLRKKHQSYQHNVQNVKIPVQSFKMLSKEWLTITVLVGIFVIGPYQGVRAEDLEVISAEKVTPAETFIKLTTTTEGDDEKNEDNIDTIIIRLTCSSNIGKAVKKYEKLPQKEKFIKRIVSEAFQENQDIVEKILQFSSHQPDFETKYFIIWTLHEEMLLSNNFKHADHVLSALEAIRNSSNFEQFSEFDKRNVEVMINSFNRMDNKAIVIKQLLKQLADMVENMTDFEAGKYAELYKLTLQLLEMKKDMKGEAETMFRTLKSRIPEIVWLLASKEPVCMYATTGWYMLASSAEERFYDSVYGGEFGTQVMVTSAGEPKTQGQWIFEPVIPGSSQLIFYIKSQFLGLFLGEGLAIPGKTDKTLSVQKSPSTWWKVYFTGENTVRIDHGIVTLYLMHAKKYTYRNGGNDKYPIILNREYYTEFVLKSC